MDNLTHSLVGLTAAKAGLERLSPGASFLCVLAANAPDGDIIVLAFGDRWTFLQHHRGITHAIVGVIGIAVALPLIFYAVDRIWSRFRNRPPQVKLQGLTDRFTDRQRNSPAAGLDEQLRNQVFSALE